MEILFVLFMVILLAGAVSGGRKSTKEAVQDAAIETAGVVGEGVKIFAIIIVIGIIVTLLSGAGIF